MHPALATLQPKSAIGEQPMTPEQVLLNSTRGYVEGILEHIQAGRIPEADGFAVIAADVLAASCLAHNQDMPESAAVLADTAANFALKRRALAVAAMVPVPDDLSTLEGDQADD
jgi:hypothetical protein